MFYQAAALIELQFLAYWSSVIIGIQLGIFFFYEYYRIKDAHLKLNRILLSFGSFIVLVIIGALFLVVVRLFDLYTYYWGILYKIGFYWRARAFFLHREGTGSFLRDGKASD